MSIGERADGTATALVERVPAPVRVYLPTIPVLALVGLFILYPIAQAIYSSFFAKSLFAPGEAEFVGLANYAEVVANPEMQQVLWNTFLWVSIGSVGAVVIGFVMGWLLHKKLPYPAVAGAIVLIPWVLPRVVGAAIWAFMFNGSQGIINELLVQLGVIDKYIVMLGNPDISIYPPILGMIWRLAPLFALLTLTALQGIDGRLYEAARMDGATPFEQFRFVTLPLMKYPLAIGFLLLLIYDIRNFAMIWVMTKGGPGVSSTTLPVMIYRTAFLEHQLGLASALSMVLFGVLLVFSYFYIRTYDRLQEGF